tara:strand:- start:2407 stop:2967 length:561 start_codon:yes stop_codon:yes gene_type:complete
MRFIFLSILIILVSNCSKTKTVLICGDHICINKAEAEKYFEENLSIEVKVIDREKNKEINLVELNLKNNQLNKREINIFKKEKPNKKLKTLSNEEITKIKQEIKNKKKENKIAKRAIDEKEKNLKNIKKEKIQPKKVSVIQNNVNKEQNNLVDVCTKIEKCSIEEISKYLLKESKNKDFPNMTTRQ